MAKITIILEGIAMCYLPADKIWRVIFPFDVNRCHKVIYQPDSDNIPLARANRTIDLTVTGGKNASSEGTQFKKLFNFTETRDYQAHTDGIIPKQGWAQHGVLLKIPNAVMSLVKETKSRYQLKLNGQLKHDFGKLGHSAKAEIELNSGGSVTINVPGEPGFPKTFHEAGGDKIIVFDNDCNQIQTVSDLELLYDFIVEDKVTQTKRFEIDRHPDDKPPNDRSSKEFPIIFGKESHDPVPMEVGLPCYVTRVDDPAGLP